MSRIPRRLLDAAPWALGLMLVAVWGPDLWRSPLLQGDLPGHVAVVEALIDFGQWPLPWGLDPRFFCGAPIGTLYPPLFHWLAATIVQLSPGYLPAEVGVKALLFAYLLLLPPSLFSAARGLGLRRGEALLATTAGLLVLALPMRGLGGSLRQTLVAGNAANAFILPFFLFFVGRLRRAIGGHGGGLALAALLIVVLLGHFLLGAMAGLSLVAYAIVRAVRVRSPQPLTRGASISAISLLGAAPFLIPFVVHIGEASPDGLVNAPLPIPIEWLTLLGLAGLALFARPGLKRSPLVGALLLLGILYGCRAVIFPLFGAPPIRMEYHRFRLFLYLALVPGALLALRALPQAMALRRGFSALAALLLAALLLVQLGVLGANSTFRYDATGPTPPDYAAARYSDRMRELPVSSQRLLILSDPKSQNGSWHGVQLGGLKYFDYMIGHNGIPALYGLRGLFVEQSPTSRAIFELERAASGPSARPHWWAIAVASDAELRGESTARLAERFRRLGVDRILARHEVSAGVRSLAIEPPRYLGGGFVLYQLPAAPLVWREDNGAPVDADYDGGLIRVSLPEATTVTVSQAFSSDWRIEEGQGTIERTHDGLIRVVGDGTIKLAFRPRLEEWLGLALGGLTWVGIGAAAMIRRLRLRANSP
ncbi:hypothetical protein ABI59_04005 [Acidobacteria bacterium Mor1]|nr:hypothetical protein ABI59_04005 [Acidobacteria bacterium Mor1]